MNKHTCVMKIIVYKSILKKSKNILLFLQGMSVNFSKKGKLNLRISLEIEKNLLLVNKRKMLDTF